MKDLFINKHFDLIYLTNLDGLSRNYSDEIMNTIYQNYKLIQNSSLPENLSGRLYEPN